MKPICFLFLSVTRINPCLKQQRYEKTRHSKQCGFSIYTFDNLKSKSMVRLVRAEKMVLSGLVFARKIARMILIQNIQGLMGPLMINMAFMPLYMWEMWDVTPVTHEHTDGRTVESRAVFSWSWIRKISPSGQSALQTFFHRNQYIVADTIT